MKYTLINGFVLFVFVSCCMSGPIWIPTSVDTYTMARLMDGTAIQIGVRLVRRIFAEEKPGVESLYRVTFDGNTFIRPVRCTAVIRDYPPRPFRPIVYNYWCYPRWL